MNSSTFWICKYWAMQL